MPRESIVSGPFLRRGVFATVICLVGIACSRHRDAADSAPAFGDRRSYQMDPARGTEEALHEAQLDLDQGADMIMVKPAGPYLDIISRVRQITNVPVVAYQVSGEYSMLEAAFRNNWLDRDRAILESLTSIKRAGADLIITYYAETLARLLPA